jgi:hypothetical protein
MSCSINASFRDDRDYDENKNISSSVASEVDNSNSQIIEREKYYKIVEEGNSEYHYYIYGDNKETVLKIPFLENVP